MFNLESFVKGINQLPQPPNYSKWLAVTDAITTHSMGRVPAKLRKRRPGEPDDVYNYRIEILESITKGSLNRAFDNLYRIFQNTSWTFIASNGLSQLLLAMTFNNTLSFKEYAEKILLRYSIEDPNALFVWLPILDEQGEIIELSPTIFPSRKIRYEGSDAILILNESVITCCGEVDKLDEKKKYNLGKDYILLTRQGIYKISLPKEQSVAVKVTFLIEADYDRLPCFKLGGNITSSGYYESFFDGFVPFANEALMTFSDHQAVNVQFSYPVREEKGMPCTNRKCRGGYIDKEQTVICTTCKGTGQILSRSPWGVYISKESSVIDNEKTVSIPAVQFHSPDSAILAYSSDEWRKFLTDAEKALHLVNITQAQSGEAKKEDQRGLFAMLQNIGDNYYENIIFNSMWLIEQSLSATPVKPVIYKPVQYQLTEAEDPIDRIYKMVSSNVPKHIIISAIETFLASQYNESNPIHKITAVLIQIDPYFAYNQTEKERMLALGVIEKADMQRSALAYPLLKKLSLDMGNDFIKATPEDLSKKIEAFLKPILSKEETEAVYDDNGNPV